MFIARLLSPKDIGVFSVTMVLLTFVATVRDMGAGGYLVQEKELTNDRIRAVWTVQLGLGLFLGALVFLCSAPVANFYAEPRMQEIMWVVALNYAINPFGSLTYAWQIREMRFDSLALIRFSATLASAVVSIYLAWRGFGPISLALGSLAATLVNAAMAIYFRPPWFPWLPGLKELGRVLGYGSQSTGATIFQTISGSAPELLLGKLQDLTAVGLYSRASGLVAMFDRLVMSSISSVAISWFAKESRDSGSIAAPFLKATSYVTAVGWAFAVSLLFLAHPAIFLLYGDQWGSAVESTRLLALALACGLPAAMCLAALMAIGDAHIVLRVTVVVTIAALILTVAGAYISLTVLAASMSVSATVRTIVWLRATQQRLQFRWSEFVRDLYKSAILGAAAGVAPCLTYIVAGPAPANIWPSLLLGVPGSILGFVGAAMVVRHPIAMELKKLTSKIYPLRARVGEPRQ